MAVIGVGIDVVDLERFAESLARTPGLAERLFTPGEASCGMASLAARFAAKEATSKALGTGIVGIRWREMEVLPNRRGKPVLILHGRAAERARQLGLTDFSVSLTHSRTDAMAFVVATSRTVPPASTIPLTTTPADA